jgi:hypothetical protein
MMRRLGVLALLAGAVVAAGPSTPSVEAITSPLRLVAEGVQSVGGDARRYVFYESGAGIVTVLDTWRGRSKRFRFDAPTGCYLPFDDQRASAAFGRALVRCRSDVAELPSRVLDLRTGEVTEPPSRFVVQGRETHVTYELIGHHWLAAKVACGERGACRALYNLGTGEQRLVPRGERPLDLDSARFRRIRPCAPFEPLPRLREAREIARLDDGEYLVKGSGHKYFDRLVLARCGAGEVTLDRRSLAYGVHDLGFSLAQGVVTWTIYKGAYAYDVSTRRRYRWLFPRSTPGYVVQTRRRVFLPTENGLYGARLP